MAYINREDALGLLNKNSITKKITLADGVSIYDSVENLPTADVVEVVRCKDCKYCDEYQKFNFERYLGCNTNGEIYKVEPNHFCSYGERKEKMTCKDCIHYKACKNTADYFGGSNINNDTFEQYELRQEVEKDCGDFKPKSRFKEMNWIDVNDRLPDKNGKYIVCNKSGAVYQTKFYTYPESKGGHWGQKDKGKNIIAWMPMPEVCLPFPMPKERKEK